MAEKRDIHNRKQRARRAQRARRPRKPARLAGSPLPSNAGVEAAYAGELDKLTNTMARATNKTIAALTAGGAATFMLSGQGQMIMGSLEQRMAALFEAKAREMAGRMLAASLKSGANSLGASLNFMAGEAEREAKSRTAPGGRPKAAASPDGKPAGAARNLKELAKNVTLQADFSQEMRDDLRVAVDENVRLIRSIHKKYYAEIREAIVDSITEGQGMKDLVPAIQRIGKLTRERARFIAVDQTRKANVFISARKMREAGIKKFRWRHSAGSETPRPHHAAAWKEDGTGGLNGGVFEIGNPPLIDLKSGERGLPGQLINCRCSMEPVIDFEDVDTEAVA